MPQRKRQEPDFATKFVPLDIPVFDLPDPDRPTSATVVPGGTSSEISDRIGCVGDVGKWKPTLRSVIRPSTDGTSPAVEGSLAASVTGLAVLPSAVSPR